MLVPPTVHAILVDFRVVVVAGSILSAAMLVGLVCAWFLLDEVCIASSTGPALPDEGLAFLPHLSLSTQLHGLLQHEVCFALEVLREIVVCHPTTVLSLINSSFSAP